MPKGGKQEGAGRPRHSEEKKRVNKTFAVHEKSYVKCREHYGENLPLMVSNFIKKLAEELNN